MYSLMDLWNVDKVIVRKLTELEFVQINQN